MVKKVYRVENLDCANCASKVEAALNALPEVQEAVLTYATMQLRITAEDPDALLPKLQEAAQKVEPEVEFYPRDGAHTHHSNTGEHEHHHDCCCGHEHHHDHDHEHNEKEKQKESPYSFAYFVLNQERKVLYERIDRRVDLMVQNGLVEEVRNLVKKGYTRDLVSMQGLGYKEICAYLCGEISLEEAIYILKRDTRHFAKRQLTWFKREQDVVWVDKDCYKTEQEQLDFCLSVLQKKGIITETIGI